MKLKLSNAFNRFNIVVNIHCSTFAILTLYTNDNPLEIQQITLDGVNHDKAQLSNVLFSEFHKLNVTLDGGGSSTLWELISKNYTTLDQWLMGFDLVFDQLA